MALNFRAWHGRGWDLPSSELMSAAPEDIEGQRCEDGIEPGERTVPVAPVTTVTLPSGND